MSNSELQQEIESQRNYTSSMSEARYNELMKIAQFGGAEGDNAMEQIDEHLAMEAQQSAFDCRNEA